MATIRSRNCGTIGINSSQGGGGSNYADLKRDRMDLDKNFIGFGRLDGFVADSEIVG